MLSSTVPKNSLRPTGVTAVACVRLWLLEPEKTTLDPERYDRPTARRRAASAPRQGLRVPMPPRAVSPQHGACHPTLSIKYDSRRHPGVGGIPRGFASFAAGTSSRLKGTG